MPLDRLILLNAPEATGIPLSLLTFNPSDPESFLAGLPFATVPATGASSTLQADATLPASVQDEADLPVLPSADTPAPPSTASTIASIRPVGMPIYGFLDTEATDYVANLLSGTSSAPGSDSSSGSGSDTSSSSDSSSSSGSGSGSSSGSGSGSSSGSGSGSSSGSGSGSSSGSGSDSSSDPGSGTGGIDPNPADFSVTILDDSGDSEVYSVTYSPQTDGTFTFDLTFTFNYGKSDPSNSGSIDFDLNIDTTASSVTIGYSEQDQDKYSTTATLSGAGNTGTWTDSGTDSSDVSDKITLNSGDVVATEMMSPDGNNFGTETYSSDLDSTEKFNLTDTGTAGNGANFTWTDFGNTSEDDHDSGNDSSDGTGSDTHNDDEKLTETAGLKENGSGLTITGTATDTLEFTDSLPPAQAGQAPPVDTQTTSNIENDNSEYKNMNGSFNGASFTVDETQADNDDDTDTATIGGSSGNTDDRKNEGGASETLYMTLSGVNDSNGSGYGSGSSSSSGSGSGSGGGSGSSSGYNGSSDSLTEQIDGGGTFDDKTHTVGGITDEDDTSTGYSSDGESGVDPDGPFSESGSGSDSIEITSETGPGGTVITGGSETSSPPNQTITGTPPQQLGNIPMDQDEIDVAELAYQGGRRCRHRRDCGRCRRDCDDRRRSAPSRRTLGRRPSRPTSLPRRRKSSDRRHDATG